MTRQDKVEGNVIVALTACPADAAQPLAESLVVERLAACVNRIPASSTYIWQGAVQNDAETLLVIKTTLDRFSALQSRVKQLHPYELPELIAIPVCAGAENYLQWVMDSVA